MARIHPLLALVALALPLAGCLAGPNPTQARTSDTWEGVATFRVAAAEVPALVTDVGVETGDVREFELWPPARALLVEADGPDAGTFTLRGPHGDARVSDGRLLVADPPTGWYSLDVDPDPVFVRTLVVKALY